MSARNFNADTDDEEDGHVQARNEGECSHQSDSDSQADQAEQQPPAKKKRSASEQREWTEMNRWDRSDSTDEEILVFIRRDLDELNSSAGILHLPGSHKDRKNEYGDFQFRRSWTSGNDLIKNTIVNCPLFRRCGCKCQAKIVQTPVQTILSVSYSHTAADHLSEKDKAKYLSHQQMSLIASAVKLAPLQTSGELIRNVQDSPTKHIDAKLKGSVTRLVRKERKNITKFQLEGVTIDNTIGSLAALSETLWFGTAVKAHTQGQCLDLHKVFIIGRQILASDRTVFLTFANAFDLLNLFRSVASGYDTQLCGDVTSKASQAALNKLGFGVNMLGSSFAPLSYTLMPAECESADAYREAYRATKAAVRRVISLPSCSKEDCDTCTCIRGLREHETVACCLNSPPYKEQKELPISYALGDNSSSFQKFVTEELELDANVCQTHATAIAKNNGSHRTYFDSNENYEDFYNFVCRITRCSFPDAGVRLQELLVSWLRSVRETRAADWFERHWCGPIKGRWLLANGGIAITGNNQGLESTWRWDRMANSQGYQVCGQRLRGSGQIEH